MRFAVRHDVVRLTVGAFARWCTVTREIRAHKRDVARAETFHRETLKSGAFFAWRAATKCARTLNAEMKMRAFERWREAVARARELETRAQFFLDSQAISFNDKYMPESCFGVWRDFVLARRRRYAAMEFEETCVRDVETRDDARRRCRTQERERERVVDRQRAGTDVVVPLAAPP